MFSCFSHTRPFSSLLSGNLSVHHHVISLVLGATVPPMRLSVRRHRQCIFLTFSRIYLHRYFVCIDCNSASYLVHIYSDSFLIYDITYIRDEDQERLLKYMHRSSPEPSQQWQNSSIFRPVRSREAKLNGNLKKLWAIGVARSPSQTHNSIR